MTQEIRAFAARGSVFHLFEILIQSPETKIFIPHGAYAPVTPRRKDPRVSENALGRAVEVIKFFAHPEALRFGVLALKSVLVTNGEDGTQSFEALVWRSYHIMRDKQRPMSEILVCPPKHIFDELISSKYIRKSEIWREGQYYLISLTKRSSSWQTATPTPAAVVLLLQKERNLLMEIKALQSVLGEITFEELQQPKKSRRKIFTETVDKKEFEPLEQQESKCAVYQLLDKPVPFDPPARSKKDQIRRLYVVTKELKITKLQLRLVILALETSPEELIGWDEGEVRGKKNKRYQTAEVAGTKIRRITWRQQSAEY